MRPHLIALLLITLGFLLALTAFLLPGEAQWSHAGHARHEHVTSLGRDDSGLLYAGTQSGRLWRMHGQSEWQDLSGTPDDVAITVLAAGHSGLLVGTSDGLYRWRGEWEQLIGTGRISDVRVDDDNRGSELIIALGNRVLERRDGHWRDTGIADAIGDTPVYRATTQPTETGHALHAGTVGRGVWTRLPGEQIWRDNSAALPADAKVFALALADNGRLLAGTDQGLYWQVAPFEPWRQLDDGLGNRRVLDLARWDHPVNATQLLAASDDGVYSINLVERQRSLETQGRWHRLTAGAAGLDSSVSWMEPDEDTIWIAAGSIYRLAWPRSGLRYAGLTAGAALALAGLYMIITGGRRGRNHASL